MLAHTTRAFVYCVLVFGTFAMEAACFSVSMLRTPPSASATSAYVQTRALSAHAPLRCSLADFQADSSLARRTLLCASTAGGVGVGLRLITPLAAVAQEEEEEEAAAPADSKDEKELPKLASRFAKGQIKTLGPAGPLGPPEAAAPGNSNVHSNHGYCLMACSIPIENYATIHVYVYYGFHSDSKRPSSEWLEGTWSVTYTFEKAAFPLTKDFAQFKQLLAGSVRSPGDAVGEESTTTQVWQRGEKGAVRMLFQISSFPPQISAWCVWD